MRLDKLESQRISRQLALDGERSQEQRNVQGQFATPYALALDITKVALSYAPNAKKCLEPACGTGSFVSAALACNRELLITAIEKDPDYFEVANSLWSSETVSVINCDFLEYSEDLKSTFDVLLSNPPYSRHHHLNQESKDKYRAITKLLTGKELSQLAGLHAYFVLCGTHLLKEGGVGAWLIPSETFSVNFGKKIKQYLTSEASIERIHFFEENDLQFGDALVSSCVLFVRKTPCSKNKIVELTKGGSISNPIKRMVLPVCELMSIPKWQHAFRGVELAGEPLKNYIKVSRGVSSGDDKFFVKDRDEWHSLGISDDWLQPVLPPPRYLDSDTVTSDEDGWPKETNKAMLRIGRDVLVDQMPDSLVGYLESCSEKSRSSYTLSHRKPWYSVENRNPAPILCTYMSRSKEKPFRFVRNKSRAITTMAYLCIYPLHEMSEQELDNLYAELQNIDPETLIACSREYGGGLRKLEPGELLQVPVEFA